jgi:hypothetical protein
MENANQLLRNRLEKFGSREVYLWKEMVLLDDELFTQIYQLIYCDNPKIAWHAAWVIDHVSEDRPDKLKPFVPAIIDQLSSLKSSSLKRHFTRMLLSQEIPENQLGQVIDVLYKLVSPMEAIAVRANSLELLYKIAIGWPDLQTELISVIESILEEELTPGMISKGRKIIRSLHLNDSKKSRTRELK